MSGEKKAGPGRPKIFRTKICFSLSGPAIEMLDKMDQARGGGARGLLVEEAIRLKFKMDLAFEEVARHPLTGLLMQAAQTDEARV